MTKNELQFKHRLKKVGWWVYEHEGRLVTNAYTSEIPKLEKISGVKCEVVEDTSGGNKNVCCRIGPTQDLPTKSGPELG